MTIVGIDPGIAGAIVALNPDLTVRLCWAADEKPSERLARVGGYAVGGWDVRGLIEELRALAPARVVMETPLAFARGGVSTALATGIGYGTLRACVLAAGLSLEDVTPAAWSRAILGSPPKGGWEGQKKAAAMAVCRERLPGLELVLPGRRVPHDGIADAGCLALYRLTR